MRYFLNFLITMLFLSSPAFAQEKPVGNELKISIKTNKDIYKIGDPFIVYGIIENTSDKPFYYNPGLSSSDFSPSPLILNKDKKEQRSFTEGSLQVMGILPAPKLLIGSKSTYKFSLHGSIEKKNVVLAQDKGGENAVKASGITIDFHRIGPAYGFLLDAPGSYFVKVSCRLGTKNSGQYISTTGFMSEEAGFEVSNKESLVPVNVHSDIKNALREEDYAGGLQDILYDFFREDSLIKKIKEKNPGLYKNEYSQLVDKYLGVMSGYTDEVRQKLLQRKDDSIPILRSFLMQASAIKNLIVMGFSTVDPVSARQKHMEVMSESIKDTADSITQELEKKLREINQKTP